MTEFVPITAVRALSLLEAAGVLDARRLLADYAAAGLTRSYALVIETIEVGGRKSTVRAAGIAAELWTRIIREGSTPDVWTGGTVRLDPSDWIGGAPAVSITGVGFHQADLDRMVEHHGGRLSAAKRRTEPRAIPNDPKADEEAEAPVASKRRRKPDPGQIPAGAVLATIKQTEAALGCSHTTVYKLIEKGHLERVEVDGMPRIKVASIWALAGASVV